MSVRTLFVLASFLVLTACKSSVVTEEDRQLPPPPPPPAAEEPVEEAEEEMDDMEDSEEEMDDEKEMDDAEESEEDSDADEEESEEESEEIVKSVDLSQSFVAFTGTKGDLVSHEGKFEDFTTDLTVVDGVPTKASAVIQISSMVTDSNGLTNHLLNEDFFESETYPTSSFMSSSIRENDDGTYRVEGELTMKGITKMISFDATITETYMTATFDLDRTLFGVGAAPEGIKSIDAAVPMEIKVVFQ